MVETMTAEEELALYVELSVDESKRDRTQYNYTIDALLKGALAPLAVWPESNNNVVKVINKEVDYNLLPHEDLNEVYKGGFVPEQQTIILENKDREALCEALEMQPCLREHCELYNASENPPVCREFKLAFKR